MTAPRTVESIMAESDWAYCMACAAPKPIGHAHCIGCGREKRIMVVIESEAGPFALCALCRMGEVLS